MPPMRESFQRSARASAAVDLHTSSCISGTAATNAACCEWETDIEKRMSATEQRVSATEQIGRDTQRKLGEIRELLQAALPKAANVAAATASCTQEATVANTNTGTSSADQMLDSQTPDKPSIVTSMQIDEAGHETSQRSTQWVRALKGFCETTTFHGLRNVAESTSNSVRRTLWITIMLISTCAFFYQCQHLGRHYLSWPVRMKITISRQEKIVFPAITICNQNAFRLVTAAEKGTYRWLDDLYKEQIISTFNYTKWGVGNQSMRDVYLQHALRKEDMIASDNFLELNVYMRDLRVQEYEQLEAYTLIDLLSDIGGSMGLLIGTSVITIFEAVDAFVFTLTSWQPRKKRRQRRSLKKYMDNYEL